jgi:hypothetical protein
MKVIATMSRISFLITVFGIAFFFPEMAQQEQTLGGEKSIADRIASRGFPLGGKQS